MERPSSRTTNRRPNPPATNTAHRVPKVALDSRRIDASGEPLVEDFESRFLSASTRPRSPALSSLPGIEPDYQAPPSFEGFDDEAAPPPDLKRRGVIMTPTKGDQVRTAQRSSYTPSIATQSSVPDSPIARRHRISKDQSSFGSMSDASTAPTEHTLPPLQTKGPPDDADRLDLVTEDDPKNFDLLAAPPDQTHSVYHLETRGEQLFSAEHLRLIFEDPKLLLRFTGFLNSHRPKSVRTLVYYLDALKALRAIQYANAITEALDPLRDLDFTQEPPERTINKALQTKADRAFEELVRDDLPAYVAYTWIQVVSESIRKRINGTLAPHLREASEGLAEVFCLSDPSRHDNPIVFASEEFQRTTQYGMSYCVGRNCRFLQGPRTNIHSVHRLAAACKAGKEHSEVFMNYRRDGSPFMNLLMIAPLLDSRGTIRYYIGAQVDVSGLVKDCTDLEALQTLVARDEDPDMAAEDDRVNAKDSFQNLSEMFNTQELESVRRHGGRMHRDQIDDDDDRASIVSHRPRLLIQDPTSEDLDQRTESLPVEQARAVKEDIRMNGRLQGVYGNYLLIRPHPSLRILFTSPSLRVPGIPQSPFLSRIGGSSRVRNELVQAFSEGRGVTAKVRWLTRPDEAGEGEGRTRWIHCTPLLGHQGSVGVWMVVLVDDETQVGDARRRFKPAPPVAREIMSHGEDRLRPVTPGYAAAAAAAAGGKSPRTGGAAMREQMAAKRAGGGGAGVGGAGGGNALNLSGMGLNGHSPQAVDYAYRPSSIGTVGSARDSELSFGLRG